MAIMVLDVAPTFAPGTAVGVYREQDLDAWFQGAPISYGAARRTAAAAVDRPPRVDPLVTAVVDPDGILELSLDPGAYIVGALIGGKWRSVRVQPAP